MSTDEIIDNVGGMSRFQIMMMVMVYASVMLMGWSMLMMSFAGTAPDWWCVPDEAIHDATFKNNYTSEVCPSDNHTCSFVYSSDKDTVINEWNLLCDSNQLPAVIISIQMFGVLLGSLLGGQSADTIGRKWTFYIGLFLHSGFNLAAAFSVSWQMFAASRFFIGMMIGCVLVVTSNFCVEFFTPKWRPVLAIPVWPIGICISTLSAWLRPNWSHQHIILAALHIPFLLGYFIVPKSLRFLLVNGRVDDAEKVVDTMCWINGVEKPTNTRDLLEHVAKEEQTRRDSGKMYTYLDIYRNWSTCWKSLIIQLIWACMSLVYYSLSFGVGKLSGNLYLNMFLLTVFEIPTAISTFPLNNKIGRRWTSFLFFALSSTAGFAVAIITTVAKSNQGILTTVFAIISKLGTGGAWAVMAVSTVEIYPTVTRHFGYGAANMAARVGGIIAPYIIGSGTDGILIPFLVVGSAMAVCAVVALILPETKGTLLQDSAESSLHHKYKCEKVVNEKSSESKF